MGDMLGAKTEAEDRSAVTCAGFVLLLKQICLLWSGLSDMIVLNTWV